MSQPIELPLGEIIACLYAEYLEAYGDQDLASVATAATVNRLLAEEAQPERVEADAA